MNFNLENNKLNIKNGNNTLYFESINKNTVHIYLNKKNPNGILINIINNVMS